MSKKILKHKKVIIGIIVILSSYILAIPTQKNRLEVSFFDVGQGDSSFINVNDRQILIDGGPDNTVLRRLGDSLPFFDRSIDIIILSHYHDDHLRGLLSVLDTYEVGRVIYQKDSPSSALFQEFLALIKNKGIDYTALDGEMTIDLDNNCSLYILSPSVLLVPPNNNNSIIAKLDCYQKKFLFSGDNEYKVEQAIIHSDIDLSADVFKASHHGSKTSNGEEFLKLISPKKVVISVGEDNKFNHPSEIVVDRLNSLGIDIYRTDYQQTVKFTQQQYSPGNY